METAVAEIKINQMQLDAEVRFLREDGRNYRQAVYELTDKIQEGLNPVVKYKNGNPEEEEILLTEAMERTLEKVSKINARTEILDDMLKVKTSLNLIRMSFMKYFWSYVLKIFKFLAALGFVLFSILLVISFISGKISLTELLDRLF